MSLEANTMQINVKLFSVLRQHVDDYDPHRGIDVELGAAARVDDVIKTLKIPMAQFPVVSCNGRILKKNDRLTDGSVLHIFQPVAGG